ncbi:MAG: hypothetical protein JST30_12720 [Armatimonadetes bacterium]|nr:hypothetical protein [Armatimonadota bacterium]
MPKAETWERIERDIAEGKLGPARDRLHGLLTAFPFDLDVRRRLGDVYWKLGYPREAGRFWFLSEELDDGQWEAVALFVADCGEDPQRILHRLKLKGPPADFGDGYARRRIEEQIEECRRRGLTVPAFGDPGRNRSDLSQTACVVTFCGCSIVVLAFAAFGVYFVFNHLLRD